MYSEGFFSVTTHKLDRLSMDLSLMTSSSPTPFKLAQSQSPSPLCRTQYKRTQLCKLLVLQTLSCSAGNPTGTTPLNGINLVEKTQSSDSAIDEEPKMGFYDRASRLQVQSFIDRIRALPSREASEIRIVFEQDGCFQSISEFKTLLMALVIAKEPEVALNLFDEMPADCLVPDSLTFCIMIRCYCEKNDLDKAKGVLIHMVENRFQPNVATVTVLVNSLCKRGRLQRALEVLEVMGRIGLKPNVQIYNCLLKGLCYVGRVEDAYEMLIRIKKEAIRPDIYTFTAVMDGFCKVGRSDEAMELLDEALETGLMPDVVTFNGLFNGYCKEGRPMEGLKVLKKMKERNCKPDCITYSTLLHGLLKWGKTRNAVRVYKEMVENGFEVDERLMNNLVRGLCKRSWKEKDLLEDAHEVFDKMQKWVLCIDASTYGMMIQTLCMGKKMDEAMEKLKQMIRTGYSPWIITFNNVIHELNQQGSFMSARSVYGAALKRGVIPNTKPSLKRKH